MWPLLGIAVVIIGFALRFNPLLVIAASVGVTGWAGGLAPLAILEALGRAFNENRFVSVVFVVLPIIGLMERAGLQHRARALIAGLKGATMSRLLFAYFLYRQVTAAIGLIPAGGHPQMVRPLIAPMTESAAEKEIGPLPGGLRYRIRAMAAATENVGVFFAEDIFLAFSPVLLIQSTLAHAKIAATPLDISLWAIPTAILALVIHGIRIWLFGRQVRKRAP
ncbi:MAG TPA: DUF969 domain-containing protein [Rhizomicrobium sp.]|jgi:uncharacterized membrane protein